MLVINSLVIILFIILAIEDVIFLEVPAYILAIGILLGLGMNLYYICIGEISIFECMLSILPGLLLLVCHLFFPASIGSGDGFALIMSELFLSMYRSVWALIITIISSVIVSIIYIIAHEYKKKIPFILYIALGHIAVVSGGNIG